MRLCSIFGHKFGFFSHSLHFLRTYRFEKKNLKLDNYYTHVKLKRFGLGFYFPPFIFIDEIQKREKKYDHDLSQNK